MRKIAHIDELHRVIRRPRHEHLTAVREPHGPIGETSRWVLRPDDQTGPANECIATDRLLARDLRGAISLFGAPPPWLSREINRLHHRDESRHLAFGRRLVKELFDRHSPGWAPEVLSGVREYLGDYIRSTWQEYYNPAVYKDAGLPNPYDVQKEALSLPSCRSRHEQVSRPWLTMLLRQGILTEDPYHDD